MDFLTVFFLIYDRRLGLIDNNGNPTGQQSNFQSVGLQSGNILGSGNAGNFGGFNTGATLGGGRSRIANANFQNSELRNLINNNNRFRTGNLLRTAVIRRPIRINNENLGSSDEFVNIPGSVQSLLSNNNLHQSSQRGFVNGRTNFDQGNTVSNAAFNSNFQGDGRTRLFSSSLNSGDIFNADGTVALTSRSSIPNSEAIRFNNNLRRFDAPFFQQQTSSRFDVQSRRPSQLRAKYLDEEDERISSDVTLTSNIDSNIPGHAASYRYSS